MVHLRGLHRGAKVTVRLYYSMLIRGIAENARYQAWQGAAGRHRDLRRRHYDNGKPDARGRLLRSVPIGDSSLLSIRARLDKSCRRLSPSPVLRMMRTNISDKLREIAAAIDRGGSAELTRLTVLKKWFGVSSHLSSFAIFIADQASRRKTKTTREAGDLLLEARTLLADVDVFVPRIPCVAATKLHACLRAFQNEHRKSAWGSLRIIRDQNLFLVECGLHIYLGNRATPSEGYRLAADYCEHYDPRYGNGLNGPSSKRIREIIGFIVAVEAREEQGSKGPSRSCSGRR
jgi:hypothetical protein